MRTRERIGAFAVATLVLTGVGAAPAFAGGAIGVAAAPAGAAGLAAMEPTPSDPPASDLPATDPPATDPPATDPPVTDPPVTDPPATDPPATDPPATDPPVTNPPATDPPATTDPPESPAPTEPLDRARALAAVPGTVITQFVPGIHRLAGIDRYGTAVTISQRYAAGVPVVYLATGADFPDALGASAAAAHTGGPLLLTRSDALPPVTRDEIVRLAPTRIVVVGGPGVIGDAVIAELAAAVPAAQVVRLHGTDRYETAERIALDAFVGVTEAYVATGRDYPDALSASSAGGARGAPVFLVDGSAASARASTVAAMRQLGVRTVRIAGGDGAVTSGIQQSLSANGFSVVRHEGADRYLTAASINTAAFAGSAPVRNVFLASGSGFADALAGAALAGATDSPLYVTRDSCIPYPVAAAITGLSPTSRVVLGGASVVGTEVERGVACAMEWAKPAAGRITDVFGPRAPICTPGGCTQSFHRGTDIGTGCWAPILAASGGRVLIAGRLGTLGNFVKLSHDSSIETGYAHLVDGGILVSPGQYVAAGQQIGWSGATGAATGCHLHFEVSQNGTQIDAVPFMRLRGVPLG